MKCENKQCVQPGCGFWNELMATVCAACGGAFASAAPAEALRDLDASIEADAVRAEVDAQRHGVNPDVQRELDRIAALINPTEIAAVQRQFGEFLCTLNEAVAAFVDCQRRSAEALEVIAKKNS